MVAEFLTVAIFRQIVAQTDMVIAGFQEAGGFPVEPQNVQDHPVKAGRHQIATLGKQGVQRGTVVFQSGLLAADAETHGAGLRSDTQFIHQPHEFGIGPVIEDDKPGVDGPVAPIQFDVMRLRMAAYVVIGLEHRDVMLRRQFIGSHQTRNAGADNGDLHGLEPRRLVEIDFGLRRACLSEVGRGLRSQTRPSVAMTRSA